MVSQARRRHPSWDRKGNVGQHVGYLHHQLEQIGSSDFGDDLQGQPQREADDCDTTWSTRSILRSWKSWRIVSYSFSILSLGAVADP